jgi:hypothetical protein
LFIRGGAGKSDSSNDGRFIIVHFIVRILLRDKGNCRWTGMKIRLDIPFFLSWQSRLICGNYIRFGDGVDAIRPPSHSIPPWPFDARRLAYLQGYEQWKE